VTLEIRLIDFCAFWGTWLGVPLQNALIDYFLYWNYCQWLCTWEWNRSNYCCETCPLSVMHIKISMDQKYVKIVFSPSLPHHEIASIGNRMCLVRGLHCRPLQKLFNIFCLIGVCANVVFMLSDWSWADRWWLMLIIPVWNLILVCDTPLATVAMVTCYSDDSGRC